IPYIDPVTGRPNLDPATGRPFEDPATGRPIVDPVTGRVDTSLLPSVPGGSDGEDTTDGGDTPGDGDGDGTPDDGPAVPPVKRLSYVAPRGVRVVVNLLGPGTLAGSNVRPD